MLFRFIATDRFFIFIFMFLLVVFLWHTHTRTHPHKHTATHTNTHTHTHAHIPAALRQNTHWIYIFLFHIYIFSLLPCDVHLSLFFWLNTVRLNKGIGWKKKSVVTCSMNNPYQTSRRFVLLNCLIIHTPLPSSELPNACLILEKKACASVPWRQYSVNCMALKPPPRQFNWVDFILLISWRTSP